jgi:mono/diheme cytochrome c family protein
MAVVAATGAHAADETPSPQEAGNVAHGAYLARAADCVACHTAPNGKPYAGGLYLNSPFGKIASTNITPDKQTGIGTWSDDDFYHALHDGKNKAGEYLYPAMPYQWYTRMTRDDVLAIKAFLFSLPPVNAPAKPNELTFPFNIRAGIAGWNAVFFKPGTFQPDSSKSAAWNRGAYLVEGPGHCASCHTPRDALQGPIAGQAYAGGNVDDWYAPNITSDVKQGIGGWSADSIVSFLKKGIAPGKGVAFGPMAQTVHDSLAHLTDDDLHAIATYLKTIPPKASYKAALLQTAEDHATGAQIYLNHCSACHQPNGQGLGNAVPPLATNGVVTAGGPQDVVRAVLSGLPAQKSYGIMPGFATVLTPQQIADVANYVRTSWGNGAPATATADMVTTIAPRARSMLAGTAPCLSTNDSKLGHAVSDSSGPVQAAMHEVTDATLLPEVKKMVESVRHTVPDAQGADIVNQLTAAYCPIVFNNHAIAPALRGPSLDAFASLVYTEVATQAGGVAKMQE